MKRNPGFILRAVMLVADLVAIVTAFAIAYYARVYFDPRPFFFAPDIWEFLRTIAVLLPIWILVLFVCGVYNESIYPYRPKIYGRLLVASLLGTMCIIAAAFFMEESIFPSRIVVAYAFGLCLLILLIEREIIRFVRKRLLRRGKTMLDAVIVGNDINTAVLIEQLQSSTDYGYRAVAVVANDEYVPEVAKSMKYRSLGRVLDAISADVIIQTDDADTDKVYSASVDHHMGYLFIPSQEILLSHTGKMQIIGTQPIISVHTTPLIGWARLAKRLQDIILGGILFLISLPFDMIIAVISKLSSPRAPIFYSEKRLTRFGAKCRIYKFRSMKPELSNMTPEAAFEKIGQPELSKQYRADGDHLDNDPRITKLGKFLRATSLDELPQLWNVVRGDISLVGPRALQPGELEKYPNRNLILSAKSGLTGLAQVSGRRDISFEERRSLDTYYIQNWSLAMDIQIVLKTILMVLLRRGAK
ncbi:UDP-phosphate galactose phosphotransferase [Alphaproteobacteria bacterium]|nr:UDP-phosphate galactose phosphotransferase [Alphaproteobacteria bacterium]